MLIRVLGTAAGGGVPQWNCGCAVCTNARSGDTVTPRTQDCIAVECGGSWVLVNASPDLRQQLLSRDLSPALGTRNSQIKELVLTDAELDHVAGLLLLREATGLRVLGTPAVLGALGNGFGLQGTLGAYTSVEWVPVAVGESVRVCGGQLELEVIGLGQKRPRYALPSGEADGGAWVTALRLHEVGDPRGVLYAPCVAEWSDRLADLCASCTSVILDGTFWTDDELARQGLSRRTAREMGHLPISDPGGSLEALRPLSAVRRIYTHMNNTTPVLDPSSPERAVLDKARIEVGTDGMVVVP